MQNKDSNNLQQPDGICQRFFNFIMSSLLARSLKRVTTSHERDEMLLPQSSRSLSDQKRANDHSSGEIMVEFRHSMKKDKVGKRERSEGKRVAIQENGDEEKNKKRREKRVLSEKLPPPPPAPEVAADEDEMRPRRRIILTNINAKSDEFIRKKREHLSRTTSIEKI